MEQLIKYMAQRFLSWKLPADFNPDCGISFVADYNQNTQYPAKHEPVGTNLFTADQTEAMLRHLLTGAKLGGPNINDMAREIRDDNEKWWTSPATGEPLQRNKGEMLMLIVSEIAEAMEGERKDRQDDHLPNRPMAEVELADAVIRIMDYSAGWGYDLEGAIAEKRAYNKTRADHSIAARLSPGGKKF